MKFWLNEIRPDSKPTSASYLRWLLYFQLRISYWNYPMALTCTVFYHLVTCQVFDLPSTFHVSKLFHLLTGISQRKFTIICVHLPFHTKVGVLSKWGNIFVPSFNGFYRRYLPLNSFCIFYVLYCLYSLRHKIYFISFLSTG